jgi:murein DD-endopeptidase MepM/ murein hydrolase activator NlpD
MAVQDVRKIAPFINVVFTITSKWWTERVNPVTGETEIHRGLDIATGNNDSVYSMLTGKVLQVGTTSSAGNYIIIYDDDSTSPTYGYATRYLHLQFQPLLPVGTHIDVGQEVGKEGATGTATGIHLHVEMQDISRFNWQWHSSYVKSDYLDPTIFMGIDNVQGTQWIYRGFIPPTPIKKHRFKWYLYADRIRERYIQ